MKPWIAKLPNPISPDSEIPRFLGAQIPKIYNSQIWLPDSQIHMFSISQFSDDRISKFKISQNLKFTKCQIPKFPTSIIHQFPTLLRKFLDSQNHKSLKLLKNLNFFIPWLPNIQIAKFKNLKFPKSQIHKGPRLPKSVRSNCPG